MKTLSRTDIRYWRQHLSRTRSREGLPSPTYSVQIRLVPGQRVRFPLGTADANEGAKLAQQIYLFSRANGAEATLLLYDHCVRRPMLDL